MTSDVFISHKTEDKPRVRRVVEGLQQDGLSVWWDLDTPGGQRWRQTIEAELAAARCVVVCWSHNVVNAAQTYVLEEAERAKKRGVLLPVRLDMVDAPFGFGEIQALDLIGWDGRSDDPRWQRVLAEVRAIVNGLPRPAPAPLPPVPPPAWRRWAVGAAGLALAASAALWLHTLPSAEEQQAWQAVLQRHDSGAQADGSDYRAHLSRFPQDAFADEARRRLAACRQQTEVSWQPHDEAPLPLVLPLASASGATEAAARQALAPLLEREAQQSCTSYTRAEVNKLQGVQTQADRIRCSVSAGQWHCGYDGQVICQLQVRRTLMREICP